MNAQLTIATAQESPDATTRAVVEAFARTPLQSGVIVLDLRHLSFLDRPAALLVVRAAGGRLILVQGDARLHSCQGRIGPGVRSLNSAA